MSNTKKKLPTRFQQHRIQKKKKKNFGELLQSWQGFNKELKKKEEDCNRQVRKTGDLKRKSKSNPLSFGIKQKKREKIKTRLVPPWFWPGGSRQGQCAAGGVTPSRPSCRWFWEASRSCQLYGVPPVAQVLQIDGEFGCSLVCIGSVLSLAVVPTALQKLHKCVTQNTTELLQDTEARQKRQPVKTVQGPKTYFNQ